MWVLRAVWDEIGDSALTDADRLGEWLMAFKRVEPEVTAWYRGMAQKASVPTAPIRDWQELLNAGLISAELGSTASAWGAYGDDGYGLTLHCGSRNRAVPNQLVLQVPEIRRESFLRLGTADRLLTDTAKCWHPKFATVSDTALWGEFPQDQSGFLPGWLTFLPSDSPLRRHANRTGWISERVDAIGDLYISGDSPDRATADVLRKWYEESK